MGELIVFPCRCIVNFSYYCIYMKRFLFFLLAISIAAVSCQKAGGNGSGSEGGSGSLTDLKANTLVVNGEERALTNVFVEEYSGYLMVTATDVPGAESFDWLVENEAEYVQVLLLPALCNREFDVMAEKETFAIYSTYASASLADGVGPGFTEGLEEGLCRVDFDGSNAEMFMNLTLSDGSTIAVRASGVYDGGAAPSDSYIERNGEKSPLRASFYSVEDGYCYFYFTSGDIDYFEEIDMVEYYVAMIVEESVLESGSTVDVNDNSAYFDIFYVDNASEEMIEISSEDPAGAEGSFSVSRLDGDNMFAAKMSVAFSEDLSVSFDFEGECTDMYAEPAKKNEFEYNGTVSPIESVVVDTTDDLWTIWLSSESGIVTSEDMEAADAVKIVAPEEAFTGEPVGLSTYKDIEFEYDGNVWNYANGSLGTLTVSLDGENVLVDFTNYDNLKGYYSGNAVVLR